MIDRRGELTIRGRQSGDYLRFKPLPELSLSSFEVTASVSGRSVTSDSLCLLGGPEFIAALRAFEKTRNGEAVLVGTDDFRLAIGPFGATGAAWVAFALTDGFPLPTGGRGRHLIEAGILLDGEFVGELVRNLSNLLDSRVSH